jgi:hypothetical protein
MPDIFVLHMSIFQASKTKVKGNEGSGMHWVTAKGIGMEGNEDDIEELRQNQLQTCEGRHSCNRVS